MPSSKSSSAKANRGSERVALLLLLLFGFCAEDTGVTRGVGEGGREVGGVGVGDGEWAER